MEVVANVLSWILILAGSFFIVSGAVGILRMPDVYTRLHAMSVIDTLGMALLILGFILQAGSVFVVIKLIFVFVLFFFVGPVATHATAQAAFHAGIYPILKEDRRDRLASQDASQQSNESGVE